VPEEPKLTISGNLNLQSDTTQCPHLAQSFDCNKYDIRRCDFKMIVGQNKFYPGIMICRDGYTYRNENPNHKYCFIQECSPIAKDNVVEAYGGPVAYAEYIYAEDTVSGGIMTNYKLTKCGEEKKEFKTSNECKYYNSKLKSI
jgi:hypothetical protein